MTNKIISTVFLAACIAFFILGNANPDNLLFLFVSSNPLVAMSRIVLATGMVLLSFKSLLHTDVARQAARGAGLSLITFGALCMIITPLGNELYNVFKILDWMIIAEAGVIFTSATLTEPTSSSLPRFSFSKSKLRQKTA